MTQAYMGTLDRTAAAVVRSELDMFMDLNQEVLSAYGPYHEELFEKAEDKQVRNRRKTAVSPILASERSLTAQGIADRID